MIYVTGDSWTQRSNTAEDYSWPLRLEQLLNHPVINKAAGMGSNTRMLSCIQDFYIQGHQPDLVIVALSNFARYHFPSGRMSHWSIGFSGLAHNDSTGEKYRGIDTWWQQSVYDELLPPCINTCLLYTSDAADE